MKNPRSEDRALGRLGYHPRVTKMATRQTRTFHQETKAQIGGLPLISVAVGGQDGDDQDPGRAHGIIAVGDDARGVLALGRNASGFIAVGGRARGVFAMGGRARGIFAMGGVATGLVAVGGVALGLVAMGGAALGLVALGGASADYVAVGSATAGRHTFPGDGTPNDSPDTP